MRNPWPPRAVLLNTFSLGWPVWLGWEWGQSEHGWSRDRGHGCQGRSLGSGLLWEPGYPKFLCHKDTLLSVGGSASYMDCEGKVFSKTLGKCQILTKTKTRKKQKFSILLEIWAYLLISVATQNRVHCSPKLNNSVLLESLKYFRNLF